MKTIMFIIDHGLAIAYFLYTDVAQQLLQNNVRLVFLVQDALIPKLKKDFSNYSNVIFESMREDKLTNYRKTYRPRLQEMLEYIRGASASPRIPLTYVDTHRQRKLHEARGRWKIALQVVQPVIYLLRYSKWARRIFQQLQEKMHTPDIYSDLFEEYQPDLAVSSTAGWRIDRYFLREARKHKIKTAVAVLGWDNPSANGLPGAYADYINVWSKIHAWELNSGIDWPMERIHIGGMPLYDNYLTRKWLIPRQEYFKAHKLDPNKKLLAFVATALSITPNLHIIEALIDVVASNRLNQPSQLLIRLHPNHFRAMPHYEAEREAIYRLAENQPDVHVVAPRPLAGNVLRYSGEDFEEKASMLANCDVMISIYSTMVVEAALHDKPVVSACINTPVGWPEHYWIPLDEVPTWPTAARVVSCNASQTAFTKEQLVESLNSYLENPSLHSEGRRKFVEQELTYLQPGEASRKTSEYLLSLIGDK